MGTAEHISKQFEADLDTTRTRVLQMGGLVEAQILAAIQAFATGDAALVAQVIENDARVNGYEVAIDGACNHIVVKRQPAASDLRLIMAISKIVTDLERIGDEAEKIARMSKRIHEHERRTMRSAFPAIRHAGADRGQDAAPGARCVRAPGRDERRRGAEGGFGDRRRVPLGAAPADHLHDGGPAHHLDRRSKPSGWRRRSSASATMPRTSPSR